ncbi:MAG: hypothetical protein HKO93_04580 [Flavobacteriales bacterium]|nr:hypothetical protein [Flavobacteriales bacterium]
MNERLKVIDVLGYKVYQGWIRQYSDLQDPSENDSLNYSVLLNGFLVVDSDLSNIKHLLLQFKSNRTLENDDSFLELRGNLDDKASLLYYYNLARLSDNLANKEFGFPFERISSANEELKKFQALVLQYEPAGDNTFHQQVFLRHNPVYKKEASSIWELVLDRPIINDIHGLKNHYNHEYEVLVQDDSLSIHLIDNRGQILWSRSLPDPILSKVEQIDIYKNGKLQIIFNTSNSIYAIDRNGRDVDGFPVMLPSTASTLLAILDYDKSRNYRLMIGLEDGRLMNYGVDSKAIKGWKYEPKDLPLIGHIIHFAIGKKDYICTIKSDGKLEFLGRNGKVRYGGAKVSLPSYDGGFYRIRPGKNIESTSIVHRNEQGELLLSKVSGSSEIIDEKALIHTQKTDRFYRVENGKYTLINSKYETRLEISTEIEDLGIELDSDLFTGLVDHMSGLFYLYDNSGELLQGFPLPGKNSYIGDMNKDGIKDIVLSDNQGVLYMYALD